MTFELQTEPGPEALAPGQTVEIRELGYGQMRQAMGAGEKPGEAADRLLAASLHVDGKPLGYDALQALPGRLSGVITKAMQQAMRLHGLETEPDADEPKS